MLIVINWGTDILSGEGGWWFYWGTVFWGICLVFHFLRTFIFSNRLEDNREEMIEKEMEKLKNNIKYS